MCYAEAFFNTISPTVKNGFRKYATACPALPTILLQIFEKDCLLKLGSSRVIPSHFGYITGLPMDTPKCMESYTELNSLAECLHTISSNIIYLISYHLNVCIQHVFQHIYNFLKGELSARMLSASLASKLFQICLLSHGDKAFINI